MKLAYKLAYSLLRYFRTADDEWLDDYWYRHYPNFKHRKNAQQDFQKLPPAAVGAAYITQDTLDKYTPSLRKDRYAEKYERKMREKRNTWVKVKRGDLRKIGFSTDDELVSVRLDFAEKYNLEYEED